MTGEAMGMLSVELYGKTVGELTEDEKATVSAFASLAAGIAGGLVGGDTSSAGNAAEAGKTTVENNFFSIPAPVAPPVAGGTSNDAKSEADKNIAKGVNDGLNSIGDGLSETFDCSFGMSCSNDIDKAGKDPNVGKDLTSEEKESLGGSVSGSPNGFEPDDERFKQQEVQTTHRKNEIKELFEYDNSRSGIQIGNRTLIEMPNKGNAKIFSGASEAEVKQYFIELTGNKSLPEARVVPGKGNIYTVKTPNGSFNLRDFSNSASETGKAWTIDIPRGIAKDAAPVEIKFLKWAYNEQNFTS
nr:VENN motif pre-toxin domain-containing protein [Providencia rettgeri]